MEAHIIDRCYGSHIFYTTNSQMVVWLTAIHTGHSLLPRFMLFISIKGRVNARATVQVEGSSQCLNTMDIFQRPH
jgi:hypothetical protein